MKKILITALCFSFSLGVMAQKDRLEKTVTTKTKVKTNKGEEVAIKKQKVSENQDLKLSETGATNQMLMRGDKVIQSSTLFIENNVNFSIEPDDKGYVIKKQTDGKMVNYGVIRKLPNKDLYLLHTPKHDAVGYFDLSGNFVVGSYDDNTDAVVLKKYKLKR
ncbi:hypothetical protein ACFSQ0_03685 [Mesonia sediminis]|uniref:WG repeat-containing protein n=1 Tax=Mesonia sediminis TaxID=1703946 RepID=A0ABW5SD37_9FLAO